MIPGSALRKLSAITGLVATKEAEGCFRLDIAPSVALFSFEKLEKKACDELRRMNLARVVRIVCEAQGWRCSRCSEIKALQGHHRTYRSRWRPDMGPLDVVTVLTGICASCHESEHCR